MTEISDDEYFDTMYPPKDSWSWVEGKITHFDVNEVISQDIHNTITALDQEVIEEEDFYIDNDPVDLGWQDDNVRLLTRDEDLRFAFPAHSKQFNPSYLTKKTNFEPKSVVDASDSGENPTTGQISGK
jgi:hypothetical protein